MSRWKILLIVVAVAVVALLAYRLIGASPQSRRGGADASAPIPVTAETVAKRDVPIHLDALGTVQALNTVTVRPQVSGQITAISFKEGQEIAKDAVIAQIDSRTVQTQLDQAVAKRRQDEAQLGGARSTLKRYEELIQKNFVAAQDLENQRHTVRQLEATVASDAAAVESARIQLGYTTIRAPIAGLAGIRGVDVGNLVQAGQGEGIVTLTEVHPINIVFTLPEQNLDLVRNAGTESLSLQALERTDNHVIATGSLAIIDNQIDAASGTFKLKAEFPNIDNALWPGQFVNVRLQVRTLLGALVIPAQAVQRGPEGSYVYLVKEDNTVAMQPVQIGVEAGAGGIIVTSGLTEGQRVVTEGQFRLKPGVSVLALAPGEVPPPKVAPTGEEPTKRTGGRRRGG